MRGTKKRMMALLFELLKNSKRSDRELSKVLGVSQPTVTRTRQRLVSEGMVREFTVIPNFVKMGYTIMAINCFKSKISKELEEKAIKSTMAKPNIIFAARAQGMGKNGVVISMHKSYADFSKFITNLRLEGGDDVEDYCTMLVSLEDFVAKHFSLKYLAELEETSED